MKPVQSSSSRTWDWLAAFLLLAALVVAAGRLVVTRWTDHLAVVQALAFLGVLAGLALGQSAFSPRLAAFFALAYGLFLVPRQLGLTLGSDIPWLDRLITLSGCLSNTVSQLARREAINDPLFFLFWMAVLFWALGVHAGYSLARRGDVWRATLPAGLTLFVIHILDPGEPSRTWSLAIYVFLTLLLLARLTFLRYSAQWRETRTRLPQLISWDFTRIMLSAVTLIVLLAWAIPTLPHTLPVARKAWREATAPLRMSIGERMGDIFAALRRAAAVVSVSDNYGPSLSLGRGSELSDALFLTVQAPPDRGGRYYWRARVYDHYANGRWSSVAFSTTQPVLPSGPGLPAPALEGRRQVTLTLTTAVPLATLYAASQPRWISRPAAGDLARNPDGTVDLSVLRADPLLYAGETYQARSSLAVATVAQLRAAGGDYPPWVAERYLQLPETITPRTRELARQIAAGIDTPYDIAAAVTDYLRSTIRYTETVPSAPSGGQEPLDWFLFDLRQGFCNYYASAEVVLLRSLGIPARLAVGFAEGERQPRSDTYLVRQRDAHAWPEVYFPGAGWVEFEPTASQPPLYRPPGADQSSAAEGGGPGGAGDAQRDRWDDRLEELLALEDLPPEEPPAAAPGLRRLPAAAWGLLLVLVVALGVVVWRSRRRGLSLPLILAVGYRRLNLRPPAALRRWAIRVTLSPMERAYLELDQALGRLGAPPAPAATPAERAAALTGLLPPAADSAQRLLAEYQATTYGPRAGDLDAARQAGRAIRALSWRISIRERVRATGESVFRSLGLRRLFGAGYRQPR